MKMPGDNRPDLRDILEAKGGTVIDIDRLFWRGTGIKEDLKRSEKEFDQLAEETGGGLWLPTSAEEMIRLAVEAAQEVDSQYVVTYALQHPIDDEAGEYLKIDLISRRVGLKIRARRGYLVKPLEATPPDNSLNPAPR